LKLIPDYKILLLTSNNNFKKQGPTVIQEMTLWLEENEYESVKQLKGSLSKGKAINPIAFERVNYLQVLQGYHL